MKSITHRISEFFKPQKKSDIIIEEKFSSITICDFEISNFEKITKGIIANFQRIIEDKDTYSLFIKVGNQEPILFGSNENSKESFARLLEEQKNFDADEDIVRIQVEISKDTSELINVYEVESFMSFWSKLPTVELLKLIQEYKNKNGMLVFYVLSSDFDEFYSDNILFINTKKDLKPVSKKIEISENCHFSNYSNYPFSPNFFSVKKRPSKANLIVDYLDRLTLVFSIISLFDITSIDKESNFYYKINGYKSFEHTLSINSLSINSKNTYYKLFEWVYSENSHISDKIGLVRNILSLSLVDESIDVGETVYHSVQSSYQTYLKENIKNYIEIRGKITDELSWISQKSGEIIKDYVGAYEKSLFVFLSFFISVFLFKFLKGGDINNIFTLDASVFSFSFLMLSILFLCYSYNKIKQEISRLKRKYSNLKNRYQDLLNKDDINKILDNDKEFIYEIDYINERKNKNTSLWIVTVLVLSLTIIGLSFLGNNNFTKTRGFNSLNDVLKIDVIQVDSCKAKD